MPTALLRAGVVQVPNSAGVYQAYNLNPSPVTVNGVTYQPADVRRRSVRPAGHRPESDRQPDLVEVHAAAQRSAGGDQYNTQGYRSNLKLPQSSDFGVVRLDHEFGSRNHFMVSDRYYRYNQLTSNQVDIGGALPGDTFGQAAASAPRPQKANYLVAGLTTNITPRLTNDFHFNFIRNYWSWSQRRRRAATSRTGRRGRDRWRNLQRADPL